MSADTARPGFLFVEFGDLALGFATIELARIRDRLAGDRPDLDLDRAFGGTDLPAAGGLFVELTSGRSFATVSDLVVDEGTAIAIHAVPEFLACWASRTGIAGIAEHRDGYGWLVETDRFLDRILEVHESEVRS